MLRAWVICRVLRWHQWVEEDRYATKLYPPYTLAADGALPVGIETKILRHCDRCDIYRVERLDGDWTYDDDNGDDGNDETPTPADLERIYQR